MKGSGFVRCVVHPIDSLGLYKYVVVFALHNGRWVFVRHRERDTWETAGGHIEPGETPMEAARRELYEEAGVTDCDIVRVCDYWASDEEDYVERPGHANGAVFLADVLSMGALPESEMAEAALFEGLPNKVTYPGIMPVLFDVVKDMIE